MKIDKTELEYTEADAIVLDYWLGGGGESKDQWAQRVWSKCKEFKETNGKGYSESGYGDKGMQGAYSNDPHELWESQKRNSRHNFLNMMLPERKHKVDEAFKSDEVIREDLKLKRESYPPLLVDQVILEFKKHPKYETRSQRENEEKAQLEKAQNKHLTEQEKKLKFYESQGRSEAAIILTHPELRGIIEHKKKKPLTKERRGKK